MCNRLAGVYFQRIQWMILAWWLRVVDTVPGCFLSTGCYRGDVVHWPRGILSRFGPRSRGLQHKQSCSGEFSLNGFEERSAARGQKRDLDYLSICKKPPLHEPARKKKHDLLTLHTQDLISISPWALSSSTSFSPSARESNGDGGRKGKINK